MLDNFDEEGMPIPRICDCCKKPGPTNLYVSYYGPACFDICEACVKLDEKRREVMKAQSAADLGW